MCLLRCSLRSQAWENTPLDCTGDRPSSYTLDSSSSIFSPLPKCLQGADLQTALLEQDMDAVERLTGEGACEPVSGSNGRPLHAPKKKVHLAHHKMGTVWIKSILKEIAPAYQQCLYEGQLPGKKEDLYKFVMGHSCNWFVFWTGEWDWKLDLHNDGDPLCWFGPDVVVSQMVRHPLDALVSGFHYHQTSSEQWLQTTGYQAALNAVPQHQGLMLEIFMARTLLKGLAVWPWDDSRTLTMDYHAAMRNPALYFFQLGLHMGLSQWEVVTHVLPHVYAKSMRYKYPEQFGKSADVVECVDTHHNCGKKRKWTDYFDQDLLDYLSAVAPGLEEALPDFDWDLPIL